MRGFFMLGWYLYRKQFIMYKNFNLTESEKEQILKQHQSHGYKKPLNEQEFGGYKEGPGEKQTPEFNHFGKIVKPKLLSAGFKYDFDKRMIDYGTENSMIYGDHSTGINVLWNKPKDGKNWEYVVWSGNNKGLKKFPIGGSDQNNMKAANDAVNYALMLKKSMSLNEQSFEDYSSDMDGEMEQSSDEMKSPDSVNLQSRLLFIADNLDAGHTDDMNVTSESMVELLKEVIKQYVNPSETIPLKDWEKLYYSITNDSYA